MTNSVWKDGQERFKRRAMYKEKCILIYVFPLTQKKAYLLGTYSFLEGSVTLTPDTQRTRGQVISKLAM